MGKIFGISDLPVTIFTTPLEEVKMQNNYKITRFNNFVPMPNDIYVSKAPKGNGFIQNIIRTVKK